MLTTLSLLPAPRSLAISGGTFALPDTALILLDSAEPQATRFAAQQLQQALEQRAGVRWETVAGTAVPPSQVGITLSVVPGGTRHPQGYQLVIAPDRIHIVASAPVGVFYGVQTLIQILEQCGRSLPTLRIRDWPDFPHRGIMLDVTFGKIPKMDTLHDFVDLVAAWKINQLQLYTEHTFAYRRHPEVWADASPLTGQEILDLDAYCRERFIELVPNQQSFGHMRRWLIHDRYRHLAECPGAEWLSKWPKEPRDWEVSGSICPGDPGSLDLLRDLYDELLPHFSSHQVHVGFDEASDLGRGRSKEAVQTRTRGRVLLDFLLKVYREVKARGYTMQFWADNFTRQAPELLAELPRDVVAMEWGYQPDYPFDEHGTVLAESGVPFYFCCNTGSSRSIAGRVSKALANQRDAAEYGLKHGAIGYLVNDFGPDGHWNALPVSYLGFAYAASVSWVFEANCDQDIARLTSMYAFRDRAGIMGQIAFDLGNASQATGLVFHYAGTFLRILQDAPAQIREYQDLSAMRDLTEVWTVDDQADGRAVLSVEGLKEALAYIDQASARLSDTKMDRPDADLIRREYDWAVDMMRHACWRGIWALGNGDSSEDASLRQRLASEADRLLAEHRELWLARNRPGRLEQSQAVLLKMRRDYDPDSG